MWIESAQRGTSPALLSASARKRILDVVGPPVERLSAKLYYAYAILSYVFRIFDFLWNLRGPRTFLLFSDITA